MDKYRIFVGSDTTEFSKVIRGLVDSGLFVFANGRLKSLDEIIKAYNGGLVDAARYVEWIVIGYTDEYTQCKRTLFIVQNGGWHGCCDFKKISLEAFLQLKKEENAS